MTGPSDPDDVRISDDDRDRAAERVHHAHHRGLLTLAELDIRLARVYAAQGRAALQATLVDLPVPVEAVDLDAGAAGLTRAGRWSVPRRLRVAQALDAAGCVHLDFTAADVAHLAVDVVLRLGARGSARLVVPVTASADLTGLRGMGRPPRSAVPAEQSPYGLHLVVSGRAAWRRDVRVVTPGRRWWQR